MITNIEDNMPHEISELMCLKCFKRWIGVYPESLLLKEIECPCGEVGYVIKTGQTLQEDSQCVSCKNNANGKCILKLQGNSNNDCGYYTKIKE